MSEEIIREIGQIKHGLPPHVLDIWHDEHPLDYARWERALATYNAGIAEGQEQLAAANAEIERLRKIANELPERYTQVHNLKKVLNMAGWAIDDLATKSSRIPEVYGLLSEIQQALQDGQMKEIGQALAGDGGGNVR